MAKLTRIFLPLDVNYFDDPDIVELSDQAQLADIKAMLLSKRLQSDGRLTRRQFERIAPRLAPDSEGESLGELIERGIWLDKGDVLERRNYLAWNDSAESVEIMKRGGKRGNHQRWHVRGLKPPSAKCAYCVEEGLVSPPDSPPESGRISPSIGIREDKRREYKTTTLADISSEAAIYSPRAVAEVLEKQVGTVEEARAALERAGCDERAIATVLALLPDLRRAS
jgi:hypothetical protein